MQGRRFDPVNDETPRPGDYWPASHERFEGYWNVVLPTGQYGTLNPSVHKVVEHEDGTISVTPSLVYDAVPQLDIPGWHGYLKQGMWDEC